MEEAVQVLPVTPWALAALSVVLVVALAVPAGGPREATVDAGPAPVATRLGAVVLALLALATVLYARLGPTGELRNPVSALVLGLGWPMLLLLPAVVGLIRPATRPRRADRGDTRPAALAALALMGFLTVPATPTRPVAIATAVGAYALVVLAVAVAFGRSTAARVEVLGLLARWAAVGRALPRWSAPHGALAVLAVVLGGAWFERYERTASWAEGLPGRGTAAAALAVAVAVAALGAAALHRATRSGAPGTAAAVLRPLALGTAVAGAARRALISAQLLADQLGGQRAIDPDPLGVVGGQLLALGLVAAGGALSAVVLARRMGEETARLPGLGVLLLLTAVSAWVVLQP